MKLGPHLERVRDLGKVADAGAPRRRCPRRPGKVAGIENKPRRARRGREAARSVLDSGEHGARLIGKGLAQNLLLL